MVNNESERQRPSREVERNTFPHRFKFGDRVVTGFIISCDHDSEFDAKYILDQLSQLSTLEKTVLFIEQGSPQQSDHSTFQMRQLADQNPRLKLDFEQRIASGYWSVLAQNHTSVQPFAKASDYWVSQGRKVVNMDCSANLSQEAFTFIASESSILFALEQVYTTLADVTYSMQETIPVAICDLLPELSVDLIHQTCDALYSIYHNKLTALKRYDATRLQRAAIREKYMRSVLEKQMTDGDIILAHPHHIVGITAQDTDSQ